LRRLWAFSANFGISFTAGQTRRSPELISAYFGERFQYFVGTDSIKQHAACCG
jgi:hypothetical protein